MWVTFRSCILNCCFLKFIFVLIIYLKFITAKSTQYTFYNLFKFIIWFSDFFFAHYALIFNSKSKAATFIYFFEETWLKTNSFKVGENNVLYYYVRYYKRLRCLIGALLKDSNARRVYHSLKWSIACPILTFAVICLFPYL